MRSSEEVCDDDVEISMYCKKGEGINFKPEV